MFRKVLGFFIIIVALYSGFIVNSFMSMFKGGDLKIYENPVMIIFLLFVLQGYSMLFSDNKKNDYER